MSNRKVDTKKAAGNALSRNTAVVYVIRGIEVVTQLLVFSLAYMLILIGFLGRTDFSPVVCAAVTGISVLILYIVRGWCENRAVTIAAHVAAVLPALIIVRDTMALMSYIVIYTVIVIYSISLILNKKNHTDEHMPIGMAAFFVVAMIVGGITGREVIESRALYYGAVFIMLQVIYHNLNNMNDIMIMNHEVSNFPAKQMVGVNTFIISVVALVCMGAMLIINNSYVYRMLGALKDVIIAALRFIIGLIPNDTEEEPVTFEPEVDRTQGDAAMPVEFESGVVQDILNGIAMIIGVVAVIAVVVCIAVAVVRLLKKIHGNDGVSEDIKEFVSPDEKRVRVGRKIKKSDYSADDAVSVKIRKLYRRMVLDKAKKNKKSVNACLTPMELSGQYITAGADDATVIYERARYSGQQLTEPELDSMKEIKKRQK